MCCRCHANRNAEAHLVRLSEPVVYFVKLDCPSSVLVLLSSHCLSGSVLSLQSTAKTSCRGGCDQGMGMLSSVHGARKVCLRLAPCAPCQMSHLDLLAAAPIVVVGAGVAEIEEGILESAHNTTSSQLASNPRSRSAHRHGRLTRSARLPPAAHVVLALVPLQLARFNLVRAVHYPGGHQTCHRCCASRGPERAQDLAVAPKCRHASVIRTNFTRRHVGPGGVALLPCLSGLDTSPGPRGPCTYTA